jgi:hypothetical protein
MWPQAVVERLRCNPDQLLRAFLFPYHVAGNIRNQLPDPTEQRIPRIIDLHDNIVLDVDGLCGLARNQLSPNSVRNLNVFVIRPKFYAPHISKLDIQPNDFIFVKQASRPKKFSRDQ